MDKKRPLDELIAEAEMHKKRLEQAQKEKNGK